MVLTVIQAGCSSWPVRTCVARIVRHRVEGPCAFSSPLGNQWLLLCWKSELTLQQHIKATKQKTNR